MKKALLFALPLVFGMVSFASATDFRCHSEEFTKAKRQLEQLVLNRAQKEAIATYEATFAKKWQATHAEKGCSHHESHAGEFVAAAAGVLTDDQFKKFRGRTRNDGEKLQNDVWSTGVYIDNLLKLARGV